MSLPSARASDGRPNGMVAPPSSLRAGSPNGVSPKQNGCASPPGTVLPPGGHGSKPPEDDPDTRCGSACCRSSALQRLARPLTYLFCISAMALTQSFLVSGYTSSIVTTLERRYNLWSRDLGIVISSYDATCMLAAIFVSYYGDRHNRARWIGRGAILMAVGAAVFTLPYFFGRPYAPEASYNRTQMDVNLCNSTQNVATQRQLSACDGDVNTETFAFALFIVAQMIIGVGASPVYILGPTYLYDNVKPQLYSIYAGVMYAMSALGPALGFLTGAALLKLYVTPGAEPEGLTEADPAWVGAWWIGYVICTFLALVTALPLLCFPKKLPGGVDASSAEERPVTMGFGKNIKDFPRQLKKLFMNMEWLFISLAIVLEQTITTGFVVFIAKYFQVSFEISASKANVFTGSVIIPGAVAGIMTGSYLMKRLQLESPGIVKLMLTLNLVPALGVVTLLFLGCKNVDLAGVTSAYQSDQQSLQSTTAFNINYKSNNLTAVCNANCACSHATYQPVCAFDQLTYFSPCHAGCTQLDVYENDKGMSVRNYTSCQCVYDDFVHQSDAAVDGKCDNGCINLIPFLFIIFIIIFVTASGHTPALLITLRSVPAERRSFALGIQNFLSRILAYIPAPIYFGRIFDAECLLRSPACDRNGACLEYDTRHLPFVLFGTCLAIKSLAMVCLVVTFLVSRRAAARADRSKATPPDTPGVSTVCGGASTAPRSETTQL